MSLSVLTLSQRHRAGSQSAWARGWIPRACAERTPHGYRRSAAGARSCGAIAPPAPVPVPKGR